ncbi:hypothetical protein V2J09_021203 [Rumex salicifolius]
MTTVGHCLCTWRHYLIGAHFTDYTDNVGTRYFQTQNKLSPKQARWQNFLAEFDYELVYKTGAPTDGLAAITVAQTDVTDTIKVGLEVDPVTNGLLLTKGKRIYVSRFNGLQKALIRECHDTKWAEHPGQRRTRVLVKAKYYWPKIRDDIDQYSQQERDSLRLQWAINLLTPHALLVSVDAPSPAVGALVESWNKQLEIACTHLMKAAKRMKKWSDKRRRPFDYRVGDLAMIKLLLQQLKSLKQVRKGFMRRYEGTFEVLAKIGKVTYKLALPGNMKIHPVVHVSMLKSYHTNLKEPSNRESQRAPSLVFQSFDQGIKEILVDKVVKKKGVPRVNEFLIHWTNLPIEEVSWEREKDLWQFRPEIVEYLAQKAASGPEP